MFCFGLPQEFGHILFDYNRDIGPNMLYGWPKMVVLMSATVCATEMMMYIALYYYLYKHDKSMGMILSTKSIKQRYKRNAVALIGQFTQFLIDFVVIIILFASTIHTKGGLRSLTVEVVLGQYGLNGVIQIMMSPTLKEDLYQITNKIRFTFLMPIKIVYRLIF